MAKKVLKKMKKKAGKKTTRATKKIAKKTRTRKPKSTSASVKTVYTPKPAMPLDYYDDLGDAGFSDMCDDYLRISAAAKKLKEQKADLGEFIQGLMEAVEADSVLGDDWTTTRVHGVTAATISREKLLANGVTIDVIQKSTVPGKEKAISLRVTRKAEGDAVILAFPVADEAS